MKPTELVKKTFENKSIRTLLPLLPDEKKTNSSCRIRACNDIEAIERFLEEYFDKPTTYRSYKKEAERFFVWCVLKGITFANLDRSSIEDYINFLADPQPREQWCGQKGGRSKKKSWKPFTGPLSASGIKTALTILNSMMSYLCDARYIDQNPFSLIRRKSRFKTSFTERKFLVAERILNDDEWAMILKTMHEEPNNNSDERKKKERLIFLVSILFLLGLRVDELVNARWHDFKKINGKWWLFVKGKGDKLGKIPVNTQLLGIIMKYRASINKSPLPCSDDDSPVIASLKNFNEALTSRQVGNLLKDLAKKTIEKFSLTGAVEEKILCFSPHWLRHLSASKQDRAGISLTHIKENLRHSNEATTRQYVHAEDEDRHKEMERLGF